MRACTNSRSARWLLLLLVACSKPGPDLERTEDLVALLPFAETSFKELATDRPDALAGDPHELFIPYGGRIDFYLRLRPGAHVRIERITFSDGDEGEIEIRLASDDTGERLVGQSGTSDSAMEFRLADAEPVAARLSFIAGSGGEGAAAGGATVTSPAIWEPPAMQARNSAAPAAIRRAPARAPNIVVYLVDTLRPDHLGAYGYAKPTSPNLDAFAEQAHLFEYVVGQSPWTRPSVASIFTGMTPTAHGTVSKKTKLDAGLPVLAEILRETGYATAAVFSNPNVSPTFGFDRGFDEVFMAAARSNDAARKSMTWLEGASPAEEPFFLYVHTSEPHQPYLASPEYRERFAPGADRIVEVFERNPERQIWTPKPETIRHLRNLYDAEIAENDAGFGELIEALRNRGLYEESLIIYVSDHGEEFFEHKRWGHGRSLGVDQLNVALLVKFPHQTRSSRIVEAVQHIDILPTILDYLGLPIPSTAEGRSLAALAVDETSLELDSGTPLFSHNVGGSQLSVVADDFKMMRRKREGELRLKGLYNWRKDPRETENLVSTQPILAAVLNTLIDREQARHTSVETTDAVLDEKIRDELRALGYLE